MRCRAKLLRDRGCRERTQHERAKGKVRQQSIWPAPEARLLEQSLQSSQALSILDLLWLKFAKTDHSMTMTHSPSSSKESVGFRRTHDLQQRIRLA